jgi:hypothetical protein
MGIAALLVGLGFMLGRLTAPAESVTSGPIAGEPPMAAKASSVEALVKAIPAPHPAPVETTAPVPTAAAAPSSVPNEPVEAVGTPQAPTTAPSATRPALAHISAPDVPPRAATTVRAVSPARSERPEPAEVTPPSSPAPVNLFVQAVQDDIKEDETARKRR